MEIRLQTIDTMYHQSLVVDNPQHQRLHVNQTLNARVVSKVGRYLEKGIRHVGSVRQVGHIMSGILVVNSCFEIGTCSFFRKVMRRKGR